MKMVDINLERSYPNPMATSPLLPLLLMSLAIQRHTPITKKKFKKEYDFIIVGGGTAGSVLAGRLSEKKCIDILVLEAGGDPPLLTEIPATIRSYINTDVDWGFRTTPQKYSAAGHVNRESPFPCGKMIGGSSVLTGRVSTRGLPLNFDDWAARGAKGWSFKEVLPYFIRMEDNVNPEIIANGYHGIKGPITTSRPRAHTVITDAVRDAVTHLGYKVIDANGPLQTGFALYQESMRYGQSCSAAKGYLVPSENRTNLNILPNATVTKILLKNKRAIGVEFDYGGYRYNIMARREVIVSAGAFNTPKLLMLSGIGPIKELKKHSIHPVADLPVGKNLQDHVSTLLFYDASSVAPPFTVQLLSPEKINTYIHNRTGPHTYPEGCIAASFLNKENSPYDVADFGQYVVYTNAPAVVTESGWRPELVEQLFRSYEGSAAITCITHLLNPMSRGYVRLRSADPYDPPIINPNFFKNPKDVKTVVAGMKSCRQIFDSYWVKNLGIKPFKNLYRGCEDLAGDEDAYYTCVTRTAVFSLFHPAGTARMGSPSDPTTVVDSKLRVKNLRGLRVVDASVMPSLPWANPMYAVVMIGEKAADIIKKTIRCS